MTSRVLVLLIPVSGQVVLFVGENDECSSTNDE